MSQVLTRKFLAKGLAVAVTTLMMGTVAHAETQEQKEIKQLRQEIEALKALVVQQQQVQQNQAVQIEQVKAAPQPSAAAPKALATKSDTEVKLYGFVRGDANYIIEGSKGDFSDVANVGNGKTSQPNAQQTKDKFVATAKTTRIGLDFKTNVNGAEVGGKLESDFAGSSDSFRIRHAYLTYENWLIGQTQSNFLSNHAPFMIDFSTNVGGGTTRTPMVRYGFDLAPATQLFLAAEKPNSSAEGIKSSVPTLTAKLAHNFDDNKGNASARALVEVYKDEDINKRKTGWGLAAGTTYQVLDPLKATLDVSYTKGVNGILYGTNANAAFVQAEDDRRIEQNEIWAVQTGLTYSILPNLKTSLGYGALFADKDTDYAKINNTPLNIVANKEVQQAWLNLVYSPVKPLEFGIEYVNGERKTFNNEKFKDNRIGLMSKYSF
ncbi:DcaP family trimeric outer membrane transporter [Acinetobacter sp. 10FS3-1]|uniref:DcaP family trimeric outer membrane transporter n=1 Tax=Acinetobacter sp. 10FS3-1 TaxID=2563897 RepID=UPI00157C5AAB|nr:DcaP family trimeric outer membrane transporter [Acinetobacter sp. 10FS3-1]MDM1781905.1 DcaP-like protein [Acinetobacter indicus]QKQ70481.1 DcaP-like protein [Acinetobacter sp. 10FS3-1]